MKKIIVVGAGAAGLMAAISASNKKNKVILIEKNEKPGKKLFITGKGRCNLTNACPMEEMLSHIPTNPRFLYSSFHQFTNDDMIAFLKSQGVETKVERGRRVFPASDKSSDIIQALKRKCEACHVDMLYHTAATAILLDEEKRCFRAVRTEKGKVIEGDALILAAGGCSYPSTGSDGGGYRLAESIGHSIKMPEPSLVPFVMKESWCRDLMGLSLKNVSVQMKNGKKKIYEGFGELLFTHFGLSGPLILTASARLGKYRNDLKKGNIRLILDLKPALDMGQLEKRYLRELDTWRNKNISNVIERMLPKKMVPVFLKASGVAEDKKARDISRQERHRMTETMKGLEMHVLGLRGFEEAIVTQGGVHVKEINPATMESKIISGVYFAGEIIDADGETGGYNLQIAWSTGYAAGMHAGE